MNDKSPFYDKEYKRALKNTIFLAAIGSAIVSWQKIEEEIGKISSIALDHLDTERHAEAFYSITNFRDKLNYANSAILGAPELDNHLLEEWERLYKKTRKSSSKRNKLAHAHLWASPVKADGDFDVWLGPPNINSTKTSEVVSRPQKHFIKRKQIDEIGASFLDLNQRLSHFRKKLYGQRLRHLSSP